MGEVLTEAKIPFIAHHQRFTQDCPDEEWLIAAGSEGWIVVTRDKNIRRKANELKAFRAKLIVFVLASSNASAADSAALVVELYPTFLKLANTGKPPAMFSVSLGRTISRVR